MMRRLFWLGVSLGAAYAGRRVWQSLLAPVRSTPRSDYQGNYDIDGVSYDPEQHDVVVSGDRSHEPALIH